MINALQLLANLGDFKIIKSEDHEHHWEVHAGGSHYFVDRFDETTLMHAFIELRVRKELQDRKLSDKVQIEQHAESGVVAIVSSYAADYKKKAALSNDPSFKDISTVLETLEKNVRDNLRYQR
jgi:hypothetical protein